MVSRDDKADFKYALLKYLTDTPQMPSEEEKKADEKERRAKEERRAAQRKPKSISPEETERRRKVAEETLQAWTTGETIHIPELILAASWGQDLIGDFLTYIIPFSEKEPLDWPLYARLIVRKAVEYAKDKNEAALKAVYDIAREYQKRLNGFNPWQYRFAYNPLEDILSDLSYFDCDEK